MSSNASLLQNTGGTIKRLNQTEIFALMRSDLAAVGIDPERYIPQRITLPILTAYEGKYKELLAQGFAECPYFEELALRLLYYLAETAISGKFRGKNIGDIFERQVDRQAEAYSVSGKEFVEWLFGREDADQFMLHLTRIALKVR